MGKIIIDNRTEISDELALKLVRRVVHDGRISKGGESYRLATSFPFADPKKEVLVYCDLNKRSDRFVIEYDHNIPKTK